MLECGISGWRLRRTIFPAKMIPATTLGGDAPVVEDHSLNQRIRSNLLVVLESDPAPHRQEGFSPDSNGCSAWEKHLTTMILRRLPENNSKYKNSCSIFHYSKWISWILHAPSARRGESFPRALRRLRSPACFRRPQECWIKSARGTVCRNRNYATPR